MPPKKYFTKSAEKRARELHKLRFLTQNETDKSVFVYQAILMKDLFMKTAKVL